MMNFGWVNSLKIFYCYANQGAIIGLCSYVAK